MRLLTFLLLATAPLACYPFILTPHGGIRQLQRASGGPQGGERKMGVCPLQRLKPLQLRMDGSDEDSKVDQELWASLRKRMGALPDAQGAVGSDETGGGGVADVLTLGDFVLHLTIARTGYHANTELPDEAICRRMLTTRIPHLPISRCRAAESPHFGPGAGKGVFATRDIGEGELITLYPADAVLMWEDETHDVNKEVTCFFSKHVPEADRLLQRALTEWRGCELPCHATMSVLGDPHRVEDASYLAHIARDGAMCESAEGADEYERLSALKANSQIMPLSVAETDSKGNPMVLHFALMSTKPIKQGEEVLVSYGLDYWDMHDRGLFRSPDDISSRNVIDDADQQE